MSQPGDPSTGLLSVPHSARIGMHLINFEAQEHDVSFPPDLTMGYLRANTVFHDVILYLLALALPESGQGL